MRFEWDERKRAANLVKHGLDFLDAGDIFSAPHVVVPSTHESEPRFLAIGTLQGRHVTVVYTTRGATVRVISFRRARHEERQKYHALYGG